MSQTQKALAKAKPQRDKDARKKGLVLKATKQNPRQGSVAAMAVAATQAKVQAHQFCFYEQCEGVCASGCPRGRIARGHGSWIFPFPTCPPAIRRIRWSFPRPSSLDGQGLFWSRS